MASTSPQPVGQTEEQLLAESMRLIDPGERAHEQRVRRYDDCYDVYRPNSTKPDKLPSWRSRVKVPFAQATIDTALVNIVSGIPRCLVHPRHPDDVASAKAMQQLMDYFISEDHLVEKQPLFAQQGLIFGVTVAKNHWLYCEQDKMARTFVPGPDGRYQEKAGPQRVVTRDGPCFEPWSVYDCWWDPNARDVDSAAYVVLRSWKSKRELADQGYDEDTGVGLYRNLDRLFELGASKTRDQTAQETFLGGQQNKRKGQYEILEIWTDDTLVVVGDRRVVLRAEPNPYWHGRKPIVIAQTRPDLFEMQGIPEVDLVRDIQAAQHTLQNMTIDSLHLTVMRGVTYRMGSVVDPNTLNLRPLFRWGVGDHDDVRPFEVPQLGSDVYNERDRLLQLQERVTGINAYVGSGDTASINQSTATAVNALQSGSNTLLRFKAEQLHHKGFQRTFEMWVDMIQQFLDHDVWVKVTGPTGEDDWQRITPQDVAGHYHIRLEGSEESLSRQQERNDAIGAANALAPYVQLGKVNAAPLIERIAVAFNFPDPEKLVVQQQPMPQPAPGGGQGNGTMLPPAQQPLTLPGGQTLPLQVQQAIEGAHR